MSISPAALDAMVAAGCTAEQIAAVVKADMAEAEAQKAEKRTRDRDRKRRQRASCPTMSRGQTRTARDITDKKEKSPHTPLKEKNKTPLNPPKRGECHKPDDVSEEVWGDFCKHRKTKRASVTETALAGIRREAEKAGWTMQDALAELVMRGWQGFNADWVEKRTGSSGKPRDPEAGKLLRAYQAGEIGFDEFNRRRAESKRGSATGPPRPIGEVISQAANGNS